MDLIEAEGGEVIPVDYTRGKRPHVVAGTYAPKRVQLCIQGLILQENGNRCSGGILCFCESRKRVHVEFDRDLRTETI